MSDTDTPQETTTPADTAEATEAVDGGADQATNEATDTPEPAVADTDTPAEDTAPTEERTYTKAEVKKFKDEAQKLRQRLKDETEAAAKAAAEASKQELADQIGRALGFIKDDEPVDPQALLEQAAEREAQIANERDQIAAKLRAYELEKALTKAANTADGDLDLLAPYLKGTGALDAIDPDADDYLDQVSAVVAAAVESNPKLRKAAPVAAPARSGGDISNGTGIPKKGPKSVEDYLRDDLAKVTRKR